MKNARSNTSGSASTSHALLPEDVIKQAIFWRVRLGSGDASNNDYVACQQWRESHEDHERAWQRLEKIDSTFTQVADQAPSIAHTTLLKTDEECHKMNRRQALRTIGGCTLGLASVGLISHQQGLLDYIQADYAATHERRLFTLKDKSQLWLNTDSTVELDFNQDKRAIHLTRGEMQLTSAPDPRPLHISTPQGSVTAQHARFTVRRDDDHALLQVADGSLFMQPKSTTQITQVHAGQAYRMHANGIQSLNANQFDYSSWTEGMFSVRNMPLKDFLTELSRYRTGIIRCDQQLNEHLISGVFQLKDTDLILKILARSANAELRFRTRWWAEIKAHRLS